MKKRGHASLPCPYCGEMIAIVQAGKASTNRKTRQHRRRDSQTFDFAAQPFLHSAAAVAPVSAPQPAQTTSSVSLSPGEERQVEYLQAERPIDIATYGWKAVGFGAAGAAIDAAIVIKAGGAWFDPFVVGLACGGVGFLLAVFWPRQIRPIVERIFGADLDGDGQVGNKEPQRVLGTVVVKEPEKNQVRYLNDVPLSCAMGEYLAALLDKTHGVTFSERGAAQYGVDGAHFGKLRDELLARRIITWKNEGNTRSGYNDFNLAAWHALAQVREMCACVRA